MRKPLAPFQAFVADANDAHKRGIDLTAQLVTWLSAAQSAESLSWTEASPPPSELLHTLDVLSEVHDRRPTLIHDALPAPTEPVAVLAERLRVVAEEMEIAGCFELAFTTVAAVCRFTTTNDPIGSLLATLHLGRITRQMNDLPAAEDYYDRVIDHATRERDGPLAARGFLGRARAQDSRGNLPAAMASYRKAIALATAGGGAYAMACQGFISLALGRGALGEALEYGWKLYDASPPGSETQVVALYELSVVALRAGFPEPSSMGFAFALANTQVPRLRLVFLGGAIRAAAAQRAVDQVRALYQQILEAMARANQPHDASQVLLHAATALHLVDASTDAFAALRESRDIAERFGYHEYEFAADRLLLEWTRASPSTTSMATEGEVGESREPMLRSNQRTLRRGIERLIAL